MWILKPKNSCCGNGIQLIQTTKEITKIHEPSVAQLYVQPYLIDNKKFDFRFYLLIACLDPLYLYIYSEGIARFCSQDYQPPCQANKDNKFSHLTNTAINFASKLVSADVFTKKSSEIISKICSTDKNAIDLWDKICESCRAVIIGILPKILVNLSTNDHFTSLAQRSMIQKEYFEKRARIFSRSISPRRCSQSPTSSRRKKETLKLSEIEVEGNLSRLPPRKRFFFIFLE
jgi:hypothetical protein